MPSSESNDDRIEKRIDLKAPIARVWRALSDSQEFGQWFRVALDGKFVEGATVRGNVTHPGYEHMKLELRIERMEAPRRLAYQWHEVGSPEPWTDVEFTLEETATGTRLTLVESGFARLSPKKRAEQFRLNEQGWSEQMRNIERHVAA